jgi:enoyl-CoA hydratase/carnithine racemase
MSGENIDGRRAYEIGLVDHLVMADKVDEGVKSPARLSRTPASAGS